jgi:hypothetical protein
MTPSKTVKANETGHPPRRALWGTVSGDAPHQVETVKTALQCEFDLDQLVNVLVHAGHAAWGDREGNLTPRERSLYLRQGDILEAAVADLKKLLYHPDLAVQAKRMRTLHEALGAAAVIARMRMEDPAADKLYNYQRTTASRAEKTKKDQLRDEALDRLAAMVLREHPDETNNWLAEEMVERARKMPAMIGRKEGKSVSRSTCLKFIKRRR